MEVGAGATLIKSGATGPGAVLVAHGIDTTVAGARGMVNGETKSTLTKRAVGCGERVPARPEPWRTSPSRWRPASPAV